MQPDEFVRTRQREWEQLSHFLQRAEREIRRLTPEEIDQLGRLYRATTSDLALAQRDFPTHRVTVYLNQLVGRAHATIYQEKPLAWRQLKTFALAGFPQLFRESLLFIFAAALLFFVPGILSAVATFLEPTTAYSLLPEGAQDLITRLENRELWFDMSVEERPYMSSFIMTNNIGVAFRAFAGGVLMGLFTLYILVFNGLLLGSVTGLAFHYGVGMDVWNFVIGHGVIELSIICFAGGAGLMLGWAILRPGLYSRRDALVAAARRAVLLLLGSVPFLVVAGLIEGFISPAETIPWPLKWVVGIGSGAVMYGYLFLAGRGRDSEEL